MFKKQTFVYAGVLAVAMISAFAVNTFSHCQIPCGIYGDDARFTMLEEHIATIEKSIVTIKNLSGADDSDMNQIVRWVQNKDTHADAFTEIVTYYFMAQRVKPADPGNADEYKAYTDKLAALHQMVFYAMKTKQTTDLAHVEKLKSLVTEFHELYN